MCGNCLPEKRAASAIAAHASALATSARTASTASVREVVRFQVAGIGQYDCCVGAGEVLMRLNGVDSAEFSYVRKEAIVRYDPARVTIPQIVAAIAKLGYRATVTPAAAV